MGQTQHMNVLKNNTIDSISINSKLIHYKQIYTKTYLLTSKREKNMSKFLKFIYVIIILSFLFYVERGVSSGMFFFSSFSNLFFNLYIHFCSLSLIVTNFCYILQHLLFIALMTIIFVLVCVFLL